MSDVVPESDGTRYLFQAKRKRSIRTTIPMSDEIAELDGLRDEIDRIDGAIADLVAERVQTSEAVAEAKSSARADLVDEDREGDVKSHYEALFRENGLGGEKGRALAESLIEVSLEWERAVEGDS